MALRDICSSSQFNRPTNTNLAECIGHNGPSGPLNFSEKTLQVNLEVWANWTAFKTGEAAGFTKPMNDKSPSFFYFDLGNVLLHFDRQVACRQIGAIAGLAASRVEQLLFDSGLQSRYEDGQFSSRHFYEVRSSKPDSAIYEEAIGRVGRDPARVFFVDDRPENVVAARQVGMDAVVFQGPSQLAKDLQGRGVEFNY